MVAAVALLLVMTLTVTMFEVSVNNRPHQARPPHDDEAAGPDGTETAGRPEIMRPPS